MCQVNYSFLLPKATFDKQWIITKQYEKSNWKVCAHLYIMCLFVCFMRQTFLSYEIAYEATNAWALRHLSHDKDRSMENISPVKKILNDLRASKDKSRLDSREELQNDSLFSFACLRRCSTSRTHEVIFLELQLLYDNIIPSCL